MDHTLGVDEPGAGGGHEEARGFRLGAQLAAPAGVAAQRLDGGRVQGQLPGLVELRAADREQAGVPAHVVAVGADRLADARPGGGQQPNKGGVGRLPRRATQTTGGCHEPSDVVGVQVGLSPPDPGGQQPGGRDLGGSVEALEVGGEASDDPEALRPPTGVGSRRQRHPSQGQLGGDGDGDRALPVAEGDEAGRAGSLPA